MHALATLLLAVRLTAEIDPDARPMPPAAALECLKSPRMKGLEIERFSNPFYLRGDFDGDGKPDYVFHVRAGDRPKARSLGLFVCAGDGSMFVLGANVGGRKLSDRPDDNFVSTRWEVLTRREVDALTAWKHDVPRPVPDAKGEAIALVWEDGIALVYWNGAKYVWAGAQE